MLSSIIILSMIPLLSYKPRAIMYNLLLVMSLLSLFNSHSTALYFMSSDISKWMLILTWVILILMNLSCPPSLGMSLMMSLLSLSLLMLFLMKSLMGFYFMFELCLLPMFGMILGWGGQPERMSAGLYMLFYTVCSSLPFMGWVVINQSLIWLDELSVWSKYMSIFIMLPFMVKTPMYLLHLWLPKAHVEAPVSGSMGLAGVLLKVGSYGVWFLVMSCDKTVVTSFAGLLMVGSALASMITSAQIDLKALIAYSSVAHMGLLTLALLVSSKSFNLGSLMMMLAHGMSGSGLFYWGSIIYERTNTRSILMVSGMSEMMTASSLTWVILILMNLSCPPSLGIWSEVAMIPASIHISWWSFISLFVLMLGVVLYNLSLYFMLSHGEMGWSSGEEANLKELMVGAMHTISSLSAPWLLWLLE